MKSVKQVTVFDPQYGDVPEEVVEEIRQLWADNEYGNDFYYYTWVPDYDGENYPKINRFFKKHNVTGDILIHWWW